MRADDRDAIVRLADTILAEQNDDWTVSRHCMGPERSLPAGKLPTGPTSAPAGISHVTIAGNVVVHNDRAYDTSLPPDSACPSSLTDADDCGEGLHFIGVSWSKVVGNTVSHNVGGILVSDGASGSQSGPQRTT